MELVGRTTLITGGARMGEAVACALAERGCDIALIYHHSKEPAQKAARKVEMLDRRALLIKADLTNPRDLKKIIPKIKSEFKRLDILVHLASVYEKTPSPLSSPPKRGRGKGEGVTDAWDQSMTIHLKSAAELSLEAAQLMQKKSSNSPSPHPSPLKGEGKVRGGTGRIVFVSDWTAASRRPTYKGYLPYYAAKAGILGLTEALALELAPDILVNAIAPGPILPPSGSSRKEILAVAKATPLKKWGGAGEIAKAVLFLAETDFVTGECIRVDGGRHLC